MSAAPTLRLLTRARPRPSLHSLIVLYDMRVELERKWAEGPYDEYDGELVQKWRDDIRDQITRVQCALFAELEGPTLRDRLATALRDEVVVHLNGADAGPPGDIGSPAFERFLSAMQAVR